MRKNSRDNYYLCNGDSMFHVNKGVIGFKMDACENLIMRNCMVNHIENKGDLGLAGIGHKEYDLGQSKSHVDATYTGYGGCATRAWSIASGRNISLLNCDTTCCISCYGHAYGIDLHLNTRNVLIRDCEFNNILAAHDQNVSRADYNNNPTPLPESKEINIDGSISRVRERRITFEGSNFSNI